MADGAPRTSLADDAEEEASSCGCKVGRSIRKYGLQSINRQLSTRWSAAGEERYSLRELERHFNQAVLEAAMRDAGMDPLDGEVSYIYDLLTDDGKSSRMRVRAVRRLERAGIDPEHVQRNFVTHPTIGSHLKNCLSVDPPTADPSAQVDRAKERVYKMQNKTEAVIRSSLEHLIETERLEADDIEVFVSAQVVCGHCGKQYDVGEFIRNDGCECRDGIDP